jgi:hypothetical protein
MKLRNIFSRSEADEVRVPEIEVDGDRLRVQGAAPELGEQDSQDGHRETRELSLPKTTWF